MVINLGRAVSGGGGQAECFIKGASSASRPNKSTEGSL